MIINSASCLVWLQKAMILKYWAYCFQRIRPHKFLSKLDILPVHVTLPCPSCFSFDNKLLTSHVWLSCESEKIKYKQSISKTERMSLGEKRLQNMNSVVLLKRVVSHCENQFRGLLPQGGSGTLQHQHGVSFGRMSLTLVSYELGWGRLGQKRCCFQPLILWLFCLTHKWRVKKNLLQHIVLPRAHAIFLPQHPICLLLFFFPCFLAVNFLPS